jgi:CBS-domain-containing membrane protein
VGSTVLPATPAPSARTKGNSFTQYTSGVPVTPHTSKKSKSKSSTVDPAVVEFMKQSNEFTHAALQDNKERLEVLKKANQDRLLLLKENAAKDRQLKQLTEFRGLLADDNIDEATKELVSQRIRQIITDMSTV